MSDLEIHLFGYPEFLIDGHPLHFKRRKTAALLAYLSVETCQGGSSPAGIGREILADLFWTDCSQEQAGAYLRQSLWECANQIGEERIIRGSGMISLDFTTGIQVDAITFDAYFRHWNFSGITSEIPTELIAEITHLYRGNFLVGFTLKNCPSFDHWQSLQAETLRNHMAQLLESCTKIWAEKSNFPQAETFASQWLALDTSNET